MGIKTIDGRGFGDIKAFALWHAIGNIEQYDVTEFFEASEMGESAADLT
jgi:hypothetical protein